MFDLGRYILGVGLFVLAVGVVTLFTGDVLVPAQMWCVMSAPAITIGAILIAASVTKI